MKTLSQAVLELQNQWNDIFFMSGDWVGITKGDEIVVSCEMHDIDDEAEIVEFIQAYLDGVI